ncbi:TPA: DUF550 domain-containing protein [Citrobacter amalonaticus]|nr:DUF550 domain-containing protein [Citrobacter amalonaticus]
MTIDKQALRRHAIAATKGSWVFSRSGANSNVQAPIELQKGDRALVVLCKLNNAGWSGQIQTENNAKFIAAANPETVLALLDELETKEEQRANWFQMAQKLGEDLDAAEKRIAVLTGERDEFCSRLKLERAILEDADNDLAELRQHVAELDQKNNLVAGGIASAMELQQRTVTAERRIAELEAGAFNPAILDVVAERQRQKSVEGWTSEHDDQYEDGELIDAAACYAKDSSLWDCIGEPPSDWPWNDEWWKPSKNMRRNLVKAGALILAEIERRDRAAGMFQGSQPVSNRDELPEEKGASLQLRNLIRRRHAEWSDATFGNVGPVGPLKHLSKEALEAAAEPDDLSEWADMQFLLWDAQRRAGISDGEITAAMEEKLKVNMARQWPEPKDGEPRLHIKADQQQEHK